MIGQLQFASAASTHYDTTKANNGAITVLLLDARVAKPLNQLYQNRVAAFIDQIVSSSEHICGGTTTLIYPNNFLLMML